MYVWDIDWVNPFAYLALPIGSHLVAWNLGIFLFYNVLPVGYSAAFDIFFTLLVRHFVAFDICELFPFYSQHILFLYAFSLKYPTLPYFICWFLFCSWKLGSLPYWVSHFSTMFFFSLFYLLAFHIFFFLSCSLFLLIYTCVGPFWAFSWHFLNVRS